MMSCIIPFGPYLKSAHTGPTPLETSHVACDAPQPSGRLSAHLFTPASNGVTRPSRSACLECTQELRHPISSDRACNNLQPEPHVPDGAVSCSYDSTPSTPPGIPPEGHVTHPSRRSIIKRNLHTHARKQNPEATFSEKAPVQKSSTSRRNPPARPGTRNAGRSVSGVLRDKEVAESRK